MPSRKARLRPEFAVLYPYLRPGEWHSAAVMADRVVAYILGRPDVHFISAERALDPAHFEFHGGDSQLRAPRRNHDPA